VYHESAAQLVSVWHVDARRSLRLIAQRSALQREAEAGVDAQRAVSRIGSLTYSWRRSSGTVFYIGGSRSSSGPTPATRGYDAFVKLQLDIDDARGLW
jgi:hypothetical protein